MPVTDCCGLELKDCKCSDRSRSRERREKEARDWQRRDQEDAEFEYEGRVNDRMTEDDYETQNLMQVGAPSHPH